MSRTNGVEVPPRRVVASPELTANLQQVLVELVTLHVTLKQAHWTVTGPGFRSVHLALDEVATSAREHSDRIAERMRSLRAVPDGRVATVAANTSLVDLPFGELEVGETVVRVTDLLQRVVCTARAVHDVVEEADPTTADLLHLIIDDLERHAWMIGAEGRS